MANSQFVDSLIRDIVAPGVQNLMQSPFFSELAARKIVDATASGVGDSALHS